MWTWILNLWILCLALEAGSFITVRGTVTDEFGNPVEGAEVSSIFDDRLRLHNRDARTKPDGSWELEIPGGIGLETPIWVSIAARHADFSTALETLVFPIADTTVDFVLEKSARFLTRSSDELAGNTDSFGVVHKGNRITEVSGEGLEIGGAIVKDKHFVAGLWNAGGGENNLQVTVIDQTGQVDTSQLASSDFLFNVEVVLVADPVTAALFPVVGAIKDGEATAWAPTSSDSPVAWEEHSLFKGGYLGLDISADGRRAAGYSPEGSGLLDVYDLNPSLEDGKVGFQATLDYSFVPALGDPWVVHDGIFGTSRNRIESDGERDYLLANKVFFDHTEVILRCVNQADRSVDWETKVYDDDRAEGFNVHVENDILVTDDQVKVLTTRREPLCIMLFCFDKRTGEVVSKQIVVDGEDLPDDFVYSKKLDSRGILTLVFAATRDGNRMIVGDDALELPGGGVFDVSREALESAIDFSFFSRLAGEGVRGSGIEGFAHRSARGGIAGDAISTVPIQAGPAPLIFAQFGDGGGLFSQIRLTSPGTPGGTATLRLFDPDGNPLPFDHEDGRLTVPGSEFEGEMLVEIPAFGSLDITSDGQGGVVGGYVSVDSPSPLAGVIVFGGPFGLAGVGSSQILPLGFSAPIETRSEGAVRTGVAVVSLEDEVETLTFVLCDPTGAAVAVAEEELPPRGQLAKFADELEWSEPVDFTSFTGSVKVFSNAFVAATVIQLRGNSQFATMPVQPLSLR